MIDHDYHTSLASSFLDGDNIEYLESLYEQYLADPHVVSPPIRRYFQQLAPAGTIQEVALAPVRARFLRLAQQLPMSLAAPLPAKQQQVNELITAYRRLGHRLAQTDPLKLVNPPLVPELTPSYYGLSDSDLTTEFTTDGLVNLDRAPLSAIIAELTQTYCGTLGAEFMHLNTPELRQWLQVKLEKNRAKLNLSVAQQQRILERLTAAEGLERYLATKFVGQKRFSIEGADSLIPMLDFLIVQAAAGGVKETIIGMSHRGRLNVLVNVVGKPAEELFASFAGKHVRTGSGDVKYHDGFSATVSTENGDMHLALAFNPSHLEIVTPVIEGSVHAKQFRYGEHGKQVILPVAIHGDAAFAGQGVIAETFNLAQVTGYKTGGTIHIVINNQVGFTTDPGEARSTYYCTDIAKGFELPIFHVNADDPEACLAVIQLALEFRTQFQRDVIIDLVCYRRFGHNEADEPAATQPLMYRVVKKHPTIRALYAQRLIMNNVINAAIEQSLIDAYRDRLDVGQSVVDVVEASKNKLNADWASYVNQSVYSAVDTKLALTTLQAWAKKLSAVPADFNLQPQVAKMMLDRKKMAEGELPLDWGFAETLAYASLAAQGHAVRLSGQDSQRGTFAHRHAVLHDMQTGATYMPLAAVHDGQAPVTIYNSILSEFAVMAFEYGYAAVCPHDLTLWEAQFGDFANGAQVVIDQFLSAAEQKWAQLNGLVLLLPHGYEGQGPEHSSARLERFLQLCAQHNLLVCTPTTPAQAFHLLRRQVMGPVRKPLVIMTPKSLLRHKLAVSSLSDLAGGAFQWVLPEVDKLNPDTVKRVIFCAGKVYYDLVQKRRELQANTIAIIRIEQLYPFPSDEINRQLKYYNQASDIIWCQEEPQNQGSWYYIQSYLLAQLTTLQTLTYCGRPASASPTSAYINVYTEELKAFLAAAMQPALS